MMYVEYNLIFICLAYLTLERRLWRWQKQILYRFLVLLVKFSKKKSCLVKLTRCLSLVRGKLY